MTNHSRRVNAVVLTGLLTVGEGIFAILLPAHLHFSGISASIVGVIVATYSLASLVSRPIVGWLYSDTRSPTIVASGGLISAAAYLAIWISSDPWVLTLLVAICGVSVALATTGGFAAFMELVRDQDPGSMMGLYTGSIGAGHMVAGFAAGLAAGAIGVAPAIAATCMVPLISSGLLGRLLQQSIGRVDDGPSREPNPPAEAEEQPPKLKRIGPPSFGNRLLRFGRNLRTASSPMIVTSFALGLHINLVGGVLMAYLPLYALGVGLSMPEIGTLFGIHAGISSAIRLMSPFIFRFVSYRSTLMPAVWTGSIALVLLAAVDRFMTIAALMVVIGVARGILRVSSAAMVMEDKAVRGVGGGSGSGIYLAGLDLGKIGGPLAGAGLVYVGSISIAFVVVGLALPGTYMVASRLARRQPGSA